MNSKNIESYVIGNMESEDYMFFLGAERYSPREPIKVKVFNEEFGFNEELDKEIEFYRNRIFISLQIPESYMGDFLRGPI
jgi:hypothetical protein